MRGSEAGLVLAPDLVLANARLVLAGEVVTGSVAVSGGAISAVDTGAAVPEGALDCGGATVIPGLIELHTDNLERHLKPRPTVEWPHGAAVVAIKAHPTSMKPCASYRKNSPACLVAARVVPAVAVAVASQYPAR